MMFMQETKHTCAKVSAFNWVEFFKPDDEHPLLFPTCGVECMPTNMRKHERGTLCMGSAKNLLAPYNEVILAAAQRVRDGEVIPGVNIFTSSNGLEKVKVTVPFRTSTEAMQAKAAVLAGNGLYLALGNTSNTSRSWARLFVLTALGDGVMTHVTGGEKKLVVRMIKELCDDGMGVFGLLDVKTAKQLFLNLVGQFDKVRERVERVETDVVRADASWASVLYVRATRTSLLRTVCTGGAGQLAPRRYALYHGEGVRLPVSAVPSYGLAAPYLYRHHRSTCSWRFSSNTRRRWS